MSCPLFEERIARYAGGDLPPGEISGLEQHLLACADCAALARALELDRLLLHSEPSELDSVDYSTMRQRIRGEILRRRRTRKLIPALLIAASLLIAVILPLMRNRPPAAPAPMPVIAQAPPATATLPQTAPPLVRRPARVQRSFHDPLDELRSLVRAREPLTASDSPVEMRIATRNPNVVIIWIQPTKENAQ